MMRKVIVSEFLTLDGVMEDPSGAEGTAQGGWGFKFGRMEGQGKFKFDELFACGALLLGRPDPTPGDLEGGLRVLRHGCAANNSEACNNLALVMSQGLGVPEDGAGALFMFDKLCKRGNATSCRNAAT